MDNEHHAKYREITERIDSSIDCVHEDTSIHSNHARIRAHTEFKRLVEYGDQLIPYLFHKITHNGCNCVILLLLSEIAPTNPVRTTSHGNVYWMIYDWLGWYLTSPHRDKDDIYHGLIRETVIEI